MPLDRAGTNDLYCQLIVYFKMVLFFMKCRSMVEDELMKTNVYT